MSTFFCDSLQIPSKSLIRHGLAAFFLKWFFIFKLLNNSKHTVYVSVILTDPVADLVLSNPKMMDKQYLRAQYIDIEKNIEIFNFAGSSEGGEVMRYGATSDG